MPDTAVKSKPRKWWMTLIKVVVTLAICAAIIQHTRWSTFAATLETTDIPLGIVVFLLLVLSVPISAYKWQKLLAVHDLHYRTISLQRWYMTALFMNYFLPTSIGGDGYRIYKTWDNPKAGSCAVLAVFMERLTGLAALLLMGYVAAIIQCVRAGDAFSRLLVVVGAVGIAAGLLSLWMIIQFRLARRLTASKWCPGAIKTLLTFTVDYRTHPGPTTVAIIVSFVFQAHTVLYHWVMLAALGVHCDVAQLTVVLAAMTVIGLLPISLGGLGLVDGSFIYLIGLYGVGYDAALSAMLLIRVMVLPLSLSGAGFYFTEPSTSRHDLRRAGSDGSA